MSLLPNEVLRACHLLFSSAIIVMETIVIFRSQVLSHFLECDLRSKPAFDGQTSSRSFLRRQNQSSKADELTFLLATISLRRVHAVVNMFLLG